MLIHSRRRWMLLLPAAFGLARISAAKKQEEGRVAENEPRRRGHDGSGRPWFTKAAFLTAVGGILAAIGGIIAAIRRSKAGAAEK